MELHELQKLIASRLDALPGRSREAARLVLDRPDDIALLSMRAVCKRAGLTPPVMSRLVRALGFKDYECFRQIFDASLRARDARFQDRAEQLVRQKGSSDGDAVVLGTLAQAELNIHRLRSPETVASIQRAAEVLVKSDRVFWLGARSSYPAMFLGAYLYSFLDRESVLVESPGGIGMDRLGHVGGSDALVALSIDPYASTTVEAACFAAERGACVVAITDGFHSPLAKIAAETVVVPIETPCFLHSMAPALTVVECLVSLVAVKLGRKAARSIAEAEAHVRAFNSYAGPQQGRMQ